MSDQPQQQRVSSDAGRVLVTGAAGFVGRYVVRELVAEGFEPACLVRNREKLIAQLPQPQHFRVLSVEGDVFDEAALARTAEGCVAAVHLIGIIEEQRLRGATFERLHIEATDHVLAACASSGIRRYLHMSALGTRADAVSAYHRTKWEAEEHVRARGLDWTIFRPSIIHGPDGEFMRMMKFFATSRFRQPVMPYFGSGRARVQPVSVLDVASCFARALKLPETIGKVYELGGPDRFTWRELYDVCAQEIAGHTRVKVPVPVSLAKLLAKTIVPLVPSALVPYKFNVAQVQMSQEDSICDIEPIERTFGILLRRFREELSSYADRIA